MALSWPKDLRLRTTTVGPHRADLRLWVEGFPARDRVSRGQQKLLAAALILAQLEVLRTSTSRRGTLLLDDPAAELDSQHLGALMAQVNSLGAQLIATATSGTVEGLENPGCRFHVEQGVVMRML